MIVKLDTYPGKAFGFKLRDDADEPARRGMLDLLRDAFNHNRKVASSMSRLPGWTTRRFCACRPLERKK